MSALTKILGRLIALALAGGTVIAMALVGVYYYVEPGVPDAAEFREIRFQIPLSVYSRDGRLMAQIGEQVRTPVRFEEIPPLLVQAFLAAEDDQFFEHSGIDYLGTIKATVNYITHPGERVAGGSTITQQIPETMNMLSRDSTLAKKFKEWFLAFRLEQEFSKQEILELYLNTTFFGQRSYGVIAAARTYFNKELRELTLSETAILAGIPPAPSNYNPYNGPELAGIRRAYVLRRMAELGWISETDRSAALAEPVESQRFGQQTGLEADYVAEMVRAEMIRRFGPGAYTSGLKVTTTIDSRLQVAADRSLRDTLIDYDRRHGYRGAIRQIDLVAEGVLDDSGQMNADAASAILDDYGTALGLEAGIVLSVDEASATVVMRDSTVAAIDFDAVAWATPWLSEASVGTPPETIADVLAPGDIARFRLSVDDGRLLLGQLPEVQGAFVSVDPLDGAIVALSGGLDYFLNNYNRATQSARQPGSSFKPFIYSAAFENGFTAASIINDAPIVEDSPELERVWRPENFSGLGNGETPLRQALKESMNLSAIRTLRNVGISNTIAHLRRFGFDGRATPANATLALGAGGVAPVDLAAAYAVLANGGYRVEPYFIQRIEDLDGEILYDASRSVEMVCRPDPDERFGWCNEDELPLADNAAEQLVENVTDLYAPYRKADRAVSAQNVYLITDIMHDVVRSGSGARAYRALQRNDLAGKTGTTNGPRDAWFAGFNADIVGIAWVGFDDDREMGNREQGGVTAIPMWIGFMEQALAGQPEHTLPRPPGIVEVRINPDKGLVASDANPNAVWEIFEVGTLPPRESDEPYRRYGVGPPGDDPQDPVVDSGGSIF